MIVNDGSLQTPEAAALALRSGYETAVKLADAEWRAKALLGVDEMLDQQELARDRTGQMEPWNREEALARLTAEQLKPQPLGTVSAQRSRTVKGLGTAATQAKFVSEMRGLDEVIDNPVSAEFARGRTGRPTRQASEHPVRLRPYELSAGLRRRPRGHALPWLPLIWNSGLDRYCCHRCYRAAV